ncbi:MAG: hypothetical protein HZA11_10110 [Nitrospirae bacterium]|nr:hypothetical protein [Nitrospirota bacterium]
MEEINELIQRYGLEEDGEHVIIPIGGNKRCFILKRRYIRVVYSETHYVDYPLTEVIEATIKYPELPLSEALYLFCGERKAETDENSEN